MSDGDTGSGALTPLAIAATNLDGELVNLLLDHNASTHYLNCPASHNALIAIMTSKKIFPINTGQEIAKKLIDKVAHINTVDEDSKTVLHHIAASENLGAYKNLNFLIEMEKEANVNAQDFNGNTPLHLLLYRLAQYYNLEITEENRQVIEDIHAMIDTLLYHGAQLHIKNNDKKSVSAIALSFDFNDDLLERYEKIRQEKHEITEKHLTDEYRHLEAKVGSKDLIIQKLSEANDKLNMKVKEVCDANNKLCDKYQELKNKTEKKPARKSWFPSLSSVKED